MHRGRPATKKPMFADDVARISDKLDKLVEAFGKVAFLPPPTTSVGRSRRPLLRGKRRREERQSQQPFRELSVHLVHLPVCQDIRMLQLGKMMNTVQTMRKNNVQSCDARCHEFTKKYDADTFIEWLDKVERIFNYKKYGDLKQIMIIESRFTSFALTWWNNVQQARRTSVYLLEARARLHETEQQRVSRYKNGLTKKLHKATALQPVFCLAEIVQLAKQASELHAQYRLPVLAIPAAAPTIPIITAPRTPVLGNCYGYGKPGHQKRVAFAKKVNVVKGLKMYDEIFTDSELSKLMQYISELRNAGRNGKLSGETFILFNQQLKGNKRELIQLGVPVFGQIKEGPTCSMEPIPTALQAVIDHLVQWNLIPESRKPNSCIINFFDEGEYSQPYLKPPHLDQPISTLFLSESEMAFGRVLVSDHNGNFKGPLMFSLREGSLLVMRGNSADMAKHVICPSPNKRVSITFFKVRPNTNQIQPSTIPPLTKAMTLWQSGPPQSYGALNGYDPMEVVVPKWGFLHSPVVMLSPMQPIVMSPKGMPRGGTGVFLPWTVGSKKPAKYLPPRAQRNNRLLALPSQWKPKEWKYLKRTFLAALYVGCPKRLRLKVRDDLVLAGFRGEFAAANAIIDALCNHLTQLDCGGSEYESVFAAIHRRRLNWIPVLQMQKYFSIADVAMELRGVVSKKIKQKPIVEKKKADDVRVEVEEEEKELKMVEQNSPSEEEDSSLE
ncbi:hypothetical protein GIB67_039552 [Kingdonia uniflora]|uniref:Fe2OG dioxygenase domain-containing protein n=1 Tax=Kingdonia uniflora TaxID=39325 RepID=A0A7J7LJ80_9MAGN|nr:hypothetical protein GIB67_039552 [Kingdonia uniflora]